MKLKKLFKKLKRQSLKRSKATGKRLTLALKGNWQKLFGKHQVLKRRKVFTTLITVLVLTAAYFLFFHSSAALAEWWDTNWHYRQAITISNSGSAQTNTQVKILSNYDVSVLVSGGKLKSNLDDLRFTTVNGQAIKYWIEDSTNTSVDVWGFLPSAPASGATIYMYYGNPNASAGKSTVGTSTYPGVSCKAILLSGVSTDGTYYIDPTAQESSDKFQAYCDMTTDTGGWTQILNLDTNDGVDHWWGDTTFWQGTGTEGSAANSLTSGYKSQAFTSLGGFSEIMVYMHTEGVEVGYGIYDMLPAYQNSSFYNLLNTANSDAGTTITTVMQHQSGASGVPLNTARPQTRYGDEFIDSWNTEAIVVNRVKRFNTDGINYMRIATTFDNTSYVHTKSGLGVHHERPTGSYICKVEASPICAYCGLVPRYGSDATSTGCYCGSVTSYDRDIAIFIRETTISTTGHTVTATPSATEEKSPGPVAYWSFDEGYGTTTQDRTTNNNDGTISGAAWKTEDMCISGKCLTDGTVSYDSSTNLNLQDGYTLETWIKPLNGSDGIGAILNHGSGATGWFVAFYRNAPWTENYFGTYLVYTTTSNVTTYTCPSTALTLNKWQHMAVSVDSSGHYNLYLDGESKSSGTMSSFSHLGGVDAVEPAAFSMSGASKFFDDVKIYSYARTPAQIKADYLARGGATSKGTAVSMGGRSSQGDFLSNGLVGYWKMDEASWNGTAGEVIDSSGNGNNGTAGCGGTCTKPTTGSGKFGNGGVFDGTDDYVSISYTNPVSATSVVAWFKRSGTPAGGHHIITGSSNVEISINEAGGGYIRTGVVTDTQGRRVFNSGSGLTDGNWHQVAMTYDGTSLKSFIDGAQTASNPVSGSLSGIAQEIGRFLSNSYVANGSIDEVRIYNRALSPKEIRQLYEWAPGPIAYYNFDEGSGTSLYDHSGNGYNSVSFAGSPDWAKGKYGGGLYFNGASPTRVNLPGAALPATSKVTICAWAKGDGQPLGDSIFEARNSGNSRVVNAHVPWSDGEMYWDFGDTSYDRIHTALDSSYYNTWTHYCFIADDIVNKMLIYVNGIKYYSEDHAKSLTISPSTFALGSYSDGSSAFYKGWLDEFKIYNYARTQKQILEDMLAGRPAQKSPVGYWKFDEGYGTSAKDSSIYGNNGAITGATWTNAGKFGKALSFDGTDDYVNCGNPASLNFGTGDFSVEFWIYYRGTTVINRVPGTVLNKNGGESNNPGFFVGITTFSGGGSNYGLVFSTTNGAWGTGAIEHTGAYIPNTWYHVVAVREGTKATIYKNGNIGTSGTKAGIGVNVNNAYNLQIGYGAWNYVNGLIDEVKIYNYALTQDEIKTEYNQGKVAVMGTIKNTSSTWDDGGFGGIAPIAEWNFEEHSGTTAYDTSGNGNTGTLTNMEESDWAVGKIGSALSFDGSNEYVNVVDSPTLNLTTIATISAWIYPRSSSFVSRGDILSKGERAVILSTGNSPSNKQLKVWYRNSSAWVECATDSNTLSENQWYYVTTVIDVPNNIYKVYINGVEKKSCTPSGNIVSGNYAYTIGGQGSYRNFNGLIDYVRIYNYARTPAQIAWDYNKGKPIAHWKFDKGEGPTAYDSSGNGNHGTISIGTTGTQTKLGSVKISDTAAAWYNGRQGKQNYSLSFDGSDDYVDGGSTTTGLNLTGESAVSFWTKTTTNDTTMIGQAGGTGKWLIMVESNNKLQYHSWASVTDLAGNTVINDGNWHHVVLTISVIDNKVRFYVDGTLDNESTATSTPAATGKLYLGSCYYVAGSSWCSTTCPNQYFNGQIDDVRIYNYALTPLQIKTLYNFGAARLGTGE